jgi:hypothetical protein
VGFLVRISPYLGNGPWKIFLFFENILYNNFLFKKYFAQNYFCSTSCFVQEKVKKNKSFFANRDSKTARIHQNPQTKTNPCKIGQIRQKSARNKESARNIFCPPENFQIRQNCTYLAEKTAIWQRWTTVPCPLRWPSLLSLFIQLLFSLHVSCSLQYNPSLRFH